MAVCHDPCPSFQLNVIKMAKYRKHRKKNIICLSMCFHLKSSLYEALISNCSSVQTTKKKQN